LRSCERDAKNLAIDSWLTAKIIRSVGVGETRDQMEKWSASILDSQSSRVKYWSPLSRGSSRFNHATTSPWPCDSPEHSVAPRKMKLPLVAIKWAKIFFVFSLVACCNAAIYQFCSRCNRSLRPDRERWMYFCWWMVEASKIERVLFRTESRRAESTWSQVTYKSSWSRAGVHLLLRRLISLWTGENRLLVWY
jgi:hypothetical protein